MKNARAIKHNVSVRGGIYIFLYIIIRFLTFTLQNQNTILHMKVFKKTVLKNTKKFLNTL